MITEFFLDMCFSTILSKNIIKQNQSLYLDILSILNHCKNVKKTEIPLNIKPKFELLETICKMKYQGKSNNNIIDSLSQSNKTSQYNDFLYEKSQENISENQSHDNVNQIRCRKKLNSLYTNYDELITILDSIRDGTFSTIDNIVVDYESMIKKIYLTIMETNKGLAIENNSSLNLNDDSYDTVLDQILTKYDTKNRISTGFDVLDTVFLGGYELSRLYMYAGAPGSGKSTIIVNSMINSATKNSFNIDTSDDKNVYVYVTLENTVEETLLRIYQNLFRKTTKQALADVRNKVDIKKMINDELLKNNSVVIIKYFKPMITTPLDLIATLDEVVTQYGKKALKLLCIDYLDLFSSDQNFDLYRIELGYITLAFKAIAVDYNIPVVTCTQLNRSAYRVKSSAELNLDQLTESSKKTEHADCIVLLVKDDLGDSRVFMKIGKNRSGKSNVPIDWQVDFSICKFIDGAIVNSNKTSVSSSESVIAFKGFA
jgi:replicative DNA helicase